MTKKNLISGVLVGIIGSILYVTFKLDMNSMLVGSSLMIFQDIFNRIIKNDERQF